MAHLRKVGSGFQLQFYVNGHKQVKHFPKGISKAVVEAERKRIESELALHKAGLKRFGEDPRATELLTLHDLAESVLNLRQHEVTNETIARNKHATYWAHVSEVQHLNTRLAEVLACWQVEVNGKAATL